MFHDRIAEKKFEQLQKQFGFNVCYETGSYLGYGTVRIAKYVQHTVSIEIDPEYYEKTTKAVEADGFRLFYRYSHWRLLSKDKHWVELILGNSPDILGNSIRSLIRTRQSFGPACFYLDAHWNDYWPLLDELKAIAESGIKDCVIIIHDCKVPGKDFQFDSYKGQDLDYEYVREALNRINPDFVISYNEDCDPLPDSGAVGILYATPP